MGIFCELNLFKPSDGAYRPGEIVSGLIKYAVDEPTEFEKITTSLKGSGDVTIKVKRNNKRRRYNSKEVYVDVDSVVQDEKIVVPVGSYKIKFSFHLPLNIPSSLNVNKKVLRGRASCRIKYYIRIKFERPGFFASNKHFKKKITVISGVTPTLLREPVIYGETKKLTQLFSRKPNTVNIKATILNSIIPIGGKIQIYYEVENNSSVLVKSIETQLMEVHHFITSGYEAEHENIVPDTDTKTASINCGDAQSMTIEINIPSEAQSLENSKIISRTYVVRLEVALPFPHFDMILNIPVQTGIIEQNYRLEEAVEEVNCNDLPPSYWESMNESSKADDDKSDGEGSDGEISDGEYDNEKSEK